MATRTQTAARRFSNASERRQVHTALRDARYGVEPRDIIRSTHRRDGLRVVAYSK